MPEKIPYGRHYLTDEDIAAVIEVLRTGPITQGEVAERFGQALAEYSGAEYGVAVSSGTAALHLAVAAAGIGPGDEVITTPMSFCASANVVLFQGGSVRFVDIDSQSLNIDANRIEEAITPRTKAIMPVDFRGHPADLPAIHALAQRHGLLVIEDASHALGSGYSIGGLSFKCGDGKHADMCTYSFHPVKHITTGEGGAVLTNDSDLYSAVYRLRKHGIDRREEMFSEEQRTGTWKYDMELLGFNYRLTDFQAALGLSQLRRLDSIKARRREIVEKYNAAFSGIEELILPFEDPRVDSNFHLYVIQVSPKARFDRYDLFRFLQNSGYLPMVHYIPIHLLFYYKNRFGYKEGDFPIAEQFYQRAISLPLYPSLTDFQVEKVIEDIKRFLHR